MITTCDPATTISADDLAGLKADITTIDTVVESPELTTTTKNGVVIDTLAGRLLQLGYLPPVTYAAGITFTDQNDLIKTIDRNGVVYAPLSSAIPFTTSGTWAGDDENKFYVVQQEIQYRVASIAALRAQPAGFAPWVEVQGYYGIGTIGGGSFYWDAASTLADDGGLTLLPDGHVGAGRWRRVVVGQLWLSMFGGVGDGNDANATANTTALQNLINSGAEDPLDFVHARIDPGAFKLNGPITLTNNLWLQGSGETTFLTFAAGVPEDTNMFVWAGSTTLDDCRISDMQMRGTGKNTGAGSDQTIDIATCISIRGSGQIQRLRVHNCRIDQFKWGIYIFSTNSLHARGVHIYNNWFDANSFASIALRGTKDARVHKNDVDQDRTGVGDQLDSVIGIWVLTPPDGGTLFNVGALIEGNSLSKGRGETINNQGKASTILGNTIDQPAAGITVETAVRLNPTADDVKMDALVQGNTITGSSSQGIIVRSDPANNTRAPTGSNIIGNTLIECAGGVRVGDATSTLSSADNTLVTGNHFRECTSHSIQFLNGSGTISGNEINDIHTSGIRVSGVGAGSYGVDVLNNRIGGTSLTGPADSDGIVIGEKAEDISIANNRVHNVNRWGVLVDGTDGVTEVDIDYNRFVDRRSVPAMQRAISVQNTTGANVVRFTNNRHRNMQDATPIAVTTEIRTASSILFGERVIQWGIGTPEGVVVGTQGDLFMRGNGNATTTTYQKSTGADNNTGWTALS